MRTNGILMAISSLPSEYGIGDFGKTAYDFVDLLKKGGIKIWQMLPINPVGYGNSPYQSECGEAIDPIYISLDELLERRLIKKLVPFNKDALRVNFDAVRNFKDKYLREAFKKQKDTSSKEFIEFDKEEKWLDNYAKFHIIFLKNNYLPWNDWDEEEKLDPYQHKVDYSEYKDEILFIKWCQFIAFKQFLKLKKYANDNDILIMGDIPFYVGGMSSDVWENQDEFLLDVKDQFSYIAGVPPDYFSKTGQRWGNPIYDWTELKNEKFAFWINRFKEASKTYDILRVDHFRAFDTYWKVPVSCPTAIKGTWETAPGYELFDQLKKEKINLSLVAEDLGDLFPSVLKLRDHYNLPGMYVLEFNVLNPIAKIAQNQVVYTGTHDNDTLMGWYKTLTIEEKTQVGLKLKVLKIKGKSIQDKFLNYAYDSIADTVIIPMQDFLKLGSYYRMNVPGVCGSPNWEFRLKDYSKFKEVLPSIYKLNVNSKRV